MKEISIVAGHVKRYGYISLLARPESVTIIFRSLCLPEIGQLFLPTHDQAHNALNGSGMIGSADCRSHVNEPHLGKKSIWGS